MQNIIEYVQNKFNKNIKYSFNTGDTITIDYEIKEGERIRLQSFKGIVIQCKTNTFTLRKISGNIGVERIFMYNQPSIKNIEINKKGNIRKSKIFYLRKLKGKKANIKEKYK
ncbi:MAG: 50S ribosomal protein L19 [Flavobacteriia bacterium]|nr:50S ribosomal protein L19 [Candidatus Bostrichicola ureolyticus]WGH27967.1 MAG: 50S ribosomal protein L19 [Candidatus Bostrichicola ureolyticus]